MKLYSYFRSSAAYRVRIALNLKGLPYQTLPVHLLKDGGQQRSADYLTINPAGLVPTLVDDGFAVSQSMAILEYLEETCPEPPLLPVDPRERARVRSLCQLVACDIHPLNNLRVLRYLKSSLDIADDARDQWYRHWVMTGLEAFELMLAQGPATGDFCHGDQPGLADVVLIPQLFNARRLDCDLGGFPLIRRVEQACNALEAFIQAAPANQPDAE